VERSLYINIDSIALHLYNGVRISIVVVLYISLLLTVSATIKVMQLAIYVARASSGKHFARSIAEALSIGIDMNMSFVYRELDTMIPVMILDVT